MVARAIVVTTAIVVFTIGIVRGTWAIGGSDSSCYGLMADAFARGALQPRSAMAIQAPWPDASLTLAPAGFIPSPVRPDAASPVCAPGFSVLLAPLRAVGGRDGIFWLTPFAGGMLVWLTFVFGRRLAGPTVGAAAAVVVAAIPVLLFQVVQPMNDVVVAMLWMAVVAAASTPQPRLATAGVLTGLALLVRPNLALPALVAGIWIAGTPALAANRWRGLLRFGVGATPFVGLALALNYGLYGHPLQTGYGSAGDLFSLAHAGTNIGNYGGALLHTQLAFPLLAFAAPIFAPKAVRGIVCLALAVSTAAIALYLFYRPFPEWWYLRFLLPAMAPLTVLACATMLWVTRLEHVVVAVAIAVAGFGIFAARDRQVLEMWRLESRFRTAGHVVRDRLPENGVFITVWESGSVKYHAGREAILWDSLNPDALDLVVKWLTDRGYEPFIMVEQWEEPAFRARFGGRSTFGDLDWPPRYEIERQVKLFNPYDRAVYIQGGFVPTEQVTGLRR